MDRWLRKTLYALLATAWVVACSADLHCFRGAVEINRVCECPAGTLYVRASDACEGSYAVDAGGSRDAGPTTGPVGEAGVSAGVDAPVDAGLDAGPVQAPARDAAVVLRDAAAAVDAAMAPDARGAVPPRCDAPNIMCADLCVDPRTDVSHCGGCGACKAGSVCLKSACVELGCSDGTREAFVDTSLYPTIAGCAATWPAASMLDERKLSACGNSSTMCQVPADACAAGWHVCGHSQNYALDVTGRIEQADCAAQRGAFAMALGDHACTPCSADGNGAACCGDDCVDQMGDCLWPGLTRWFGVRDGNIQFCGKIQNPTPSAAIGVMCCRS